MIDSMECRTVSTERRTVSTECRTVVALAWQPTTAQSAARGGTCPCRSTGTVAGIMAQPAPDTNRSPNEPEDLDFGPSGYLPEKASKRARKIILRAPLGLQWVVASLAAGVVLVIAGVLFLQRGSAEPGPPWTPLMPVGAVSASSHDDGVLVVGATGRVRAFITTDPTIAWCPASNRLEGSGGRAWSLTGRGLGGTPSLDEHPTLVTGGIVYIDRATTVAGPTPSSEPVTLGC